MENKQWPLRGLVEGETGDARRVSVPDWKGRKEITFVSMVNTGL
jgi:hypothetical protein